MRIQFGIRFWAGGSRSSSFLDEIIYEHFAKWFWAFDIVYAGATSTRVAAGVRDWCCRIRDVDKLVINYAGDSRALRSEPEEKDFRWMWRR